MILNKIFIHLMNKNNTYDYKDLEKSCEKIADDYAISFAEWVIDYSFNGMYSNDINELLKEFKKEKGL